MLEFKLAAILSDSLNKIEQSTVYLFNKEQALLLPLKISPYIANKIIELGKEDKVRPDTYTLMHNMVSVLNAEVKCIIIHNHLADIFYSYIRLADSEKTTFDIDSKPSDAIALALKWHVPIFVSTEVTDKTAIKITKEMLKKFI
jgi:bifunctional DNase/RNase